MRLQLIQSVCGEREEYVYGICKQRIPAHSNLSINPIIREIIIAMRHRSERKTNRPVRRKCISEVCF